MYSQSSLEEMGHCVGKIPITMPCIKLYMKMHIEISVAYQLYCGSSVPHGQRLHTRVSRDNHESSINPAWLLPPLKCLLVIKLLCCWYYARYFTIILEYSNFESPFFLEGSVGLIIPSLVINMFINIGTLNPFINSVTSVKVTVLLL